MPGNQCEVHSCGNWSFKTKQQSITYHSFPKERDLRELWIKFCNRSEQWNTKAGRICSTHFTKDDYEVNLRAQLMGEKVTPKLKPGAIPTIPPRKPKTNEAETVEEIPKNLEKAYKNLLKQFKELQVRFNRLEMLYKETLKKEENLQEFSQEQRKLCEKNQQELTTKESNCQKLTLEKNKLESSLDIVFSRGQKEMLLHQGRRVTWSLEDVAKAFTIKNFSKQCYGFLRYTLKYPLPHESTLIRWASRVNCRQGLQKDLLKCMEVTGRNLEDRHKVTVLHYIEFPVQQRYERDKKTNEIIGPYKKMQIIFATGLWGDWKQPVYFGFDVEIIKDTLLLIAEALDAISYRVVAYVSDCSSMDLGITQEKPYLETPIETQKKIYCFIDATLLLSLARKQLIETGFVLKDGSTVVVNPLQTKLRQTRLTKAHVENHTENADSKENISLAQQFFSLKTSIVLRGNPGTSADNTGRFIQTIASWFNVVNSPIMDLNHQNKILNHCCDLVENMRCIGGTDCLMDFQRGILLSSNSLKLLFNNLNENINSRKLFNRKCCTEFIANINKDYPTPLQAMYRLRNRIIADNPGILAELEETDQAEDYLEIDDDSNLHTSYLCKTLAQKFCDKPYHMANIHEVVDESLEARVTIIEPSIMWLRQAKQLENSFTNLYNEKTWKACSDIEAVLVGELLKKHGEVPEEVVRAFVQQRILLSNCDYSNKREMTVESRSKRLKSN